MQQKVQTAGGWPMRRWVSVMALSTILLLVNWEGMLPWAEELPAIDEDVYGVGQTAKEQEADGLEITQPDIEPNPNTGGDSSSDSEHASTANTELDTIMPVEEVPVSSEIYAMTQTGAQMLLPVQPAGLIATATGPNSVQLSWHGPETEGVTYQVYMARGDSSFVWQRNSLTTQVEITGLMPVTEYRFYVSMTYNGQSSEPSETVNVTTPPSIAPPQVVKKKPAGSNTKRHERIEVSWSDWLDPATINKDSFIVRRLTDNSKIAGRYSWDENTRTMYFVPDQLWAANTSYSVVINSGVKSTSGFSARYTYWSFTTINSPFLSPHGTYLFSTAPCALCHSAHAASGSKLLVTQTVAALCLSCHDGSGSVVMFADLPQIGHTSTSSCCLCHNPHRPQP